MWITPPVHFCRYIAGYTVTITKPDNTQVTIGPIDSYYGDSTAWFEYTVDQVGTWKLKFNSPGVYYPAGNYCRPGQITPPGFTSVAAGTTSDRYTAFYESCYYEPSSTAEQELIVQQEQVPSWPPSSLPTDYWTRPVQSELREWSTILGDYPWYGPGGGSDWPANTNPCWSSSYKFTPYVQAPNTAHIAWKRQGAISGLIGAGTGIWSFSSGGGNPSMIYQGRCFQTITKVKPTLINGTYYDQPASVWQCYDLRTGEVYWEQTGISQTPTAIEYYLGAGETPGAEFGAFNMGIVPIYIGNGRLIKYDASTGAVSVNVSISPLTTGTYYMNGYALSIQTLGTGASTTYRLINWTTLGPTTNFTQRIISNITWPWSSLPATTDFEVGIAATLGSVTPAGAGIATGTTITGASLKTGSILWNITVEGERTYSGSCNVADHGKVAALMMGGYYMAWDLNSGKLAWKSQAMAYPWSQPAFGAYSVQSAYGLFYREAYDGVYAFDWDTGKIAWKYEAPAPNAYETPTINENGTTVYSFNAGGIIADGKLYTYNTEHTPSQPITRGWRLHCINATTGEGIWNITGTMTPGAVADGYITASNGYDGYMYVFGKGKSAITISAPQTAISIGTTVLLQGTILDQSPGQPGTPCVSEDSMTTYMEFLHMQKLIPTDFTVTGVPIKLLAIDPDGNTSDLGTVTSDMSGKYQLAWTPTKEGTYKITATFAGDNSYGSTWDETGLVVSEATAPTPTATNSLRMSDFTGQVAVYIAAGVIAIIIAIVIIGVVILRKRP